MTLTVPDFGYFEVRLHESDLSVVNQVFIDGDYDFSHYSQNEWIQKRYEDLCASGATPVIIDAGANIGIATLWFAKKYPKAQVVAIEPDPENAECCRRNTRGLANVLVVEAAVGSKPGKAALANIWNVSWAVQTQRSDDNGAGVPIQSISDLKTKVEGGRLLIVKIDIEGFESDLFSDNTDWIDEPALVIIEPHDWMLPGERSSRGFQKALAARDFDILARGDNLLYFKCD